MKIGLKEIKKEKNNIIRFLKKLVEIPTVVPPGKNYKLFVNTLEKDCWKLGLKTKKMLVPEKYEKVLPDECKGNPRWILMAKWDNGAKKTLHYSGHYDVVPPTSGFTADPFKLRVIGNKLMARGTSDMKCGIVAMLTAIKIAKKLKIKPAWNMELSFVPDEEIGGELGAGYICSKGFVKADSAIVGEGEGGLNYAIAHKGILTCWITVYGKAAHAGAHQNGINAYLKAAKLAGEFEKLRMRIQKRRSKFPGKGMTLKPTLMTGGIAGGGQKTNTVPDKFEFTIDRRIIPEEKPSKVRKEIIEVLKRFKKKDKTFKYSIKTKLALPSSTNRKAYICKLMDESIEDYFGKKANPKMCAGRLDVELFINRAKIPTIGYGVAKGKSYHGDDEFADIRGIYDCIGVYLSVMKNLGSK